MSIGIYFIVNEENLKTYVGSTGVSFERRFEQHRNDLRIGRHSNQYLQNSWNKYGESSFRFYIKEVCTVDQLLIREQYWIDFLRSNNRNLGYNLTIIAESRLGCKHEDSAKDRIANIQIGKCMSSITKQRMSASQHNRSDKGYRTSLLRNRLKGRPKSEEHKKLISKGLIGISLSSEHVQSLKTSWNNTKEKRIIALKASWNDPVKRAKRIVKMRKTWYAKTV